MSSAALELYTALIDAGVDKEKAEKAAQSVISKEDAKTLATKSDISDVKAEIANSRATTIQWVAAMLVAQAAAIVALQNLIG